jgi:hypothetical protein
VFNKTAKYDVGKDDLNGFKEGEDVTVLVKVDGGDEGNAVNLRKDSDVDDDDIPFDSLDCILRAIQFPPDPMR